MGQAMIVESDDITDRAILDVNDAMKLVDDCDTMISDVSINSENTQSERLKELEGFETLIIAKVEALKQSMASWLEEYLLDINQIREKYVNDTLMREKTIKKLRIQLKAFRTCLSLMKDEDLLDDIDNYTKANINLIFDGGIGNLSKILAVPATDLQFIESNYPTKESLLGIFGRKQVEKHDESSLQVKASQTDEIIDLTKMPPIQVTKSALEFEFLPMRNVSFPLKSNDRQYRQRRRTRCKSSRTNFLLKNLFFSKIMYVFENFLLTAATIIIWLRSEIFKYIKHQMQGPSHASDRWRLGMLPDGGVVFKSETHARSNSKLSLLLKDLISSPSTILSNGLSVKSDVQFFASNLHNLFICSKNCIERWNVVNVKRFKDKKNEKSDFVYEYMCTGREENVTVEGGKCSLYASNYKLFIGGKCSLSVYTLRNNAQREAEKSYKYPKVNVSVTSFLDFLDMDVYTVDGAVTNIVVDSRDYIFLSTSPMSIYVIAKRIEQTSTVVYKRSLDMSAAVLAALPPSWCPNCVSTDIVGIYPYNNSLLVFTTVIYSNDTNDTDEAKKRDQATSTDEDKYAGSFVWLVTVSEDLSLSQPTKIEEFEFIITSVTELSDRNTLAMSYIDSGPSRTIATYKISIPMILR